ncbi:TadE/TadG family type IV pilus assembly protein [Parvularcula sp. LCG005]|uniref:TadE/TadG family type IV pilus assembly protein n=1 Tax=Parvularcula sp. LCG005 TaxID=3078805 RepID=UPI0029427A14|nr:TadE/TadG family type IV pilus assembly protein [Parvularcula sp. LCG005]WOI54029.1 TadE/TadG family type IV pilus assembly protein [Parvularcula sp. LCG005]
MLMHLIQRFRHNQAGVAAAEFAMVLPLLVGIAFGIFEMTTRVQIVDEFERYAYQFGDYLSRSNELTEADVTEIFDVAGTIMTSVDFAEASLGVTVASIGYDEDGTPVILWSTTRGGGGPQINLDKTIGLAEPGQSVLYTTMTVTAPTLFDIFGGTTITKSTRSIFKPRNTRAIAMDGSLVEDGTHVDGYSQ